MVVKDRSIVKEKDGLSYFLTYTWIGFKKVIQKPIIIIFIFMIFALEMIATVNLLIWSKSCTDVIDEITRPIWCLSVFLLFMFIDFGMLYRIGKPIEANKAEIRFIRAGFINSVGEAPYLVSTKTDPKNSRIKIYTFDSNAVPISEWNDKKEYIEAGLDITIISISMVNGKRYIEVKFVDAKGDLPKYIEWEDPLLSSEDFTLIAGIGPDSLPLKINLNKIPMVLIGGATGSGKSVLLKLLLMQAINKDAQVIISDFKGGVDFPHIWHENCTMCFDEDRLIEILAELVGELNKRKYILKTSGYPNISSHNAGTGDHLKRIIFACDEIAEVLDTRGLSKEQKDKVNQIEGYLSTIARQGRAFGIHLILATQRPDSNIIPGQIKNNCQCKICGSCDQVLSQIVLDCSDAADQIPKDMPGRFMINDSKMTIFQSYVINENEDIKRRRTA